MIPKLNRGFSFKGLTAYLMNGKRGDDQALAAGRARVGFHHLINFVGDEARDPAEAAKVMALTVRDADLLKRAAGIKDGGKKAAGGPVWHASLAWERNEQPTDAEMIAAVEQCLAAVGLDVGKGFQTVIVRHTDTKNPHVHVCVNLVHPITGKQANPYRDWTKAQEWGHRYDRERGNVFCQERERKYADRQKWIAMGRPKRPSRAFVKAAREDVKPAIERLRKDTAARKAAVQAAENAAFAARTAAFKQLIAQRRQGRLAIGDDYAARIDAVWKGTAERQGPKPSPDWGANANVALHLMDRATNFEFMERTLRGRLHNASTLAGRGGIFRRFQLTFDAKERRATFEQQQRDMAHAAARGVYLDPALRLQRMRPPTKTAQANKLKEMRTADLAKYNAETDRLVQALKTRQTAERALEKAKREATDKAIAAEWYAFRKTFQLFNTPTKPFNRAAEPRPVVQAQPEPAPAVATPAPKLTPAFAVAANPPTHPAPIVAAQPEAEKSKAETVQPEQVVQPERKTEPEPERKADRFGRSRNRAPRDPARRQQRAEERANVSTARPRVEAAPAFEGVTAIPAPANDTHSPDQAVVVDADGRVWSAEEIAALKALEARRAAEREQAQTFDLGRTR